jgi:hypothetical protein
VFEHNKPSDKAEHHTQFCELTNTAGAFCRSQYRQGAPLCVQRRKRTQQTGLGVLHKCYWCQQHCPCDAAACCWRFGQRRQGDGGALAVTSIQNLLFASAALNFIKPAARTLSYFNCNSVTCMQRAVLLDIQHSAPTLFAFLRICTHKSPGRALNSQSSSDRVLQRTWQAGHVEPCHPTRTPRKLCLAWSA